MGARYEIIPEPEKCTGCRRCQMICSFEHAGEFNLSRSLILIGERDDGSSVISFAGDCDTCAACVRYCVYGALRLGRRA